MLGGFILLAGLTVHGPMGLIAVSAAWLAIYPFLLSWSVTYLHREWQVAPLSLLRPFLAPALAVAFIVGFSAWLPSFSLGG